MIAPLDWGLGHAVRDIPIINDLIINNYEVIIASSGNSSKFLKHEFPQLKHYSLPSINIKYSKRNNFFLKILFQSVEFIRNIKRENKALESIIAKEGIDLIISDNRYGIFSKKIPSIFISHQIFIKLPKNLRIFEGIIYKTQLKFIKRFNSCFIPDYKGSVNLSGDLSHKYGLNDTFKFIGPLSEFKSEVKLSSKTKYDILVILSGPEPQRTVFENILLKQIKESGKKTLIIRGDLKNNFERTEGNIKIVDHLNRKEIQKAVLSSDIIISRSGYTSIMDLIALKKKAILIATPGQTEQEYLAEYKGNNGFFVFYKQNNFILNKAIEDLNEMKPDFSVFDEAEKYPYLELIQELLLLNSSDELKHLIIKKQL